MATRVRTHKPVMPIRQLYCARVCIRVWGWLHLHVHTGVIVYIRMWSSKCARVRMIVLMCTYACDRVSSRVSTFALMWTYACNCLHIRVTYVYTRACEHDYAHGSKRKSRVALMCICVWAWSHSCVHTRMSMIALWYGILSTCVYVCISTMFFTRVWWLCPHTDIVCLCVSVCVNAAIVLISLCVCARILWYFSSAFMRSCRSCKKCFFVRMVCYCWLASLCTCARMMWWNLSVQLCVLTRSERS